MLDCLSLTDFSHFVLCSQPDVMLGNPRPRELCVTIIRILAMLAVLCHTPSLLPHHKPLLHNRSSNLTPTSTSSSPSKLTRSENEARNIELFGSTPIIAVRDCYEMFSLALNHQYQASTPQISGPVFIVLHLDRENFMINNICKATPSRVIFDD